MLAAVLTTMSGTSAAATATHLQVDVGGSTTADQQVSIRIRARDDAGAVDTGYRGTVHFTSTDPNATVPADYTFTAADNGDHTFTPGVTFISPGNQRVTATDTAQPSVRGDSTATLVFPMPATHLQVDASAGSITSGDSLSLRIRARNDRGDIDTNYRGTVHFTSTDAAATLPADYLFTAADNGDHTLSDAVVLRTGGDQSVTAVDTSTAAVRGDTVPTLVFTFSATHLQVDAGGGSVDSGTPLDIRIRPRDDRGDIDTGYRGTVHFTSTDPNATLPADYTFTAADNGDHTITPGVTYRSAGNQSISATDTAHPAVRGDSGPTLVFGNTATRLEIDAPGGSITAGDTADLRVRVRNDRGDIDTNYRGTVHFTSSDPGATLPTDYTFTAADNGDHTFSDELSFASAGRQDVSVNDIAHPSIRDDSISTLVVPVAGTRLEVDAPGGSITAGDTADLRVRVRNDRGDIDTNYRGTVHFTSSDQGATLPADYTFTAADSGDHTFSGELSFATAGNQAVTVVDTAQPSVRDDSAATLVFAAPATHLEVSGLSSSEAPGTGDSVRVRALNDRNDVDSAYRGTVHFTSSDPGATLPADYTFTAADNGDHTFTPGVTFQTAGNQTVLASDTARPGVHGLSPATQVASTPILALDIFTSTVSTGDAIDFRVTAQTASRTTDTAYRGTIHLTSSDPGITLPADYTFTASDNGAHTFTGGVTFGTGGAQSIVATDTSSPSRRGADSTLVFPSAATHLDVQVFDGSLTAGHPVGVRIRALNGLNDIDTAYRGTVHFTSTDPGATLPADYTFTAADNGDHTFSNGATYATAGNRSVSANDTARSTVRGDSGSSQVYAAAATYLDVQVFDSQVTAGQQVGLRVRAFNFNGDVDTGYRGTIHFNSTDPGAVMPNDYTFTASDNGDHTFTNGVTYVTGGNRSLSAADIARPTVRGDSGSTLVLSASATHFEVDVFDSQVTAGQQSTIRVRARNDNNDVDTGYRGTIHFSSTDPGATLPPDYTFTAGDAGDKTFSNGLVYATPGNRSIAAADTAQRAIRGDSGDTLVLFTGASHLDVDVFAGSITAGHATTIRVRARNDNNDVDTGYRGTIHFTSTDPGAALPPDYTFTAGDAGDKTFSNGLVYATPGNRSIATTDTSTSGIRGDSGDTYVFPAAATNLDVESFTGSTTPGSPLTFEVTARNGNGDIDTGYRGTVHFTSTDANATLPADYTFQAGDNGRKTFTDGASFATGGNQAITAADTAGGSTVRGFTADVFVQAGPPPTTTSTSTTSTSTTSTTSTSTTTTTLPANAATHLDVEVFAGQVTAGHPVDVRVTARDASNQIASAYTGTIHFTSTDSAAVLPADYTFVAGDSGRHTFTAGIAFATAGNQRVTATDTSASSVTGSTGPVLVFDPNATHYDIEVFSGSVTAGQPVDVRITARNDNNDIDTGYRGTIHFTSTDATATLPADYTFTAGDGGRRTFTGGVTFATPGNQKVTVTDTARSTVTGTSGSVLVQAAAATHLQVGLSASSATSGQPVDAHVTAVNAEGGIDTGYSGTVHFTSTDPAATLPADYTFTAADAGQHTFIGGVKFQSSGNQTVTATDTAHSTVSGTSGAVLVNAPPASTTTTTTTSTTTTSTTSTTSTPTTSTTSTTVPSSTTTTTPPCTPPTVNVQPASLRAGDHATVSGCGFGANQPVRLDFFSTPFFLGTAQSDSTGNYSMVVTIPADAPAGNHHIVASGPNAQSVSTQGTGNVFVEGPPTTSPPTTAPAGPPVDNGGGGSTPPPTTAAPGGGTTGGPVAAPPGGGTGTGTAAGTGTGGGGTGTGGGGTGTGTGGGGTGGSQPPPPAAGGGGTSPQAGGTGGATNTGGNGAGTGTGPGGTGAGTGTGGAGAGAGVVGAGAGTGAGTAGGTSAIGTGVGVGTAGGAMMAGTVDGGPTVGSIVPTPTPSPTPTPTPSPTPASASTTVRGAPGGRQPGGSVQSAAGPPAKSRTETTSAAEQARAEGIGVPQGDRSAIVTAVREPDQISTSGRTIAVNVVLALALIIMIGFPADIFNSTLAENYDEITGWFRFRRRRAFDSFERGFDRLPTIFRLGLYGLLGAVIYGLLDPHFGFNRPSLILVLGLLGALAVISVVLDLVRNSYLSRSIGKRGRLKAYPAGLAIGAILVFFSRVGHFHPGYVFGIFTGLAFDDELFDEEDGRGLFIGGVGLLAVAILALLFRIPVAHAAAKPGAGFGILVLDAALATLWLSGIQAIVWGLMPIKFLYGKKLMAWSKAAWFAVYSVGMVLFVHTLLHPAMGLYGTSSQASLFSVLMLFIAFGLFSVLFWSYFRFRRRPAPPPTRRLDLEEALSP